jgi:hypothetical protein
MGCPKYVHTMLKVPVNIWDTSSLVILTAHYMNAAAFVLCNTI